jgi:transcription elongation factor Elf1
MKSPALHVLVTVSGGVADLLCKPCGVTVSVLDYDVEGSAEGDPNIAKDADGRLCCLSEFPPSEEIVGNRHWPIIKKALDGVYYRTWKCPDCGTQTDCSYEDLAKAGTPICTDCDTEMELQ